MKKNRSQYLWGTLLIILGILFLLQEFGQIGSAWDSLWTIIMGMGGLAFLWVYTRNKDQWWAAIPGMTLIGLSITAIEAQLDIFAGKDWTGSLFLVFVGFGFWLVYLKRNAFWWAIIPGGTLLTLGAVSGFGSTFTSEAGIFFLGLGITFALVGILPNKKHKHEFDAIYE